jgi:hypothetical protein
MVGMGYERVVVDHCIYVRTSSHSTSIVSMHINNMVATASSKEELISMKRDLGKVFDLVNLREVQWLLGIGVKRNRATCTICLSQTAYIKKITMRLGLENVNPIHTPLDKNVVLSKAQCPTTDEGMEEMKKFPYLVAVGSLMYAAMGTHPDIAFVVAHLSQFSSNLGPEHWTAARRVVCYLTTMKDKVRVLGGLTGLTQRRWTDSDWGADSDHQRSVSGYAFSLGGGAIMWSSKKQPTIATSSTEGEYMAGCNATKECLWLQTLLKLIGFEQLESTTIYCDNKSTITLTKDPSFHARTKHIDIQHHFVHKRVQSHDVKFVHLHTREMPANALTKALPHPQFEHLIRKLGVLDPSAHLST